MRGWVGVTPADLARRVPRDAAYPSEVVDQLAVAYTVWAERAGLRVDLLWAQMLLETGGLRFGGQVKPWQYNLCGLKTTAGDAFASFASPILGVVAHVMHMAWYAYPAHLPLAECSITYDPRHRTINGKPHQGAGAVVVVGDLGGGRWANSAGYAAGIVRVWERGA